MSKQPPQVQFNFEPDTIEKPADDIIDEIIEDVIDEKEVGVNLPDIAKQEIVQEDVFEYPDNLAVLPDKVKKDIESDFMEKGEVFKEPKPRKQTLNKNGKPRKKLSEEHKQKLKLAREKALEVRRLKAAERKKEKAFVEEEKALQRKKKQQDFDKLKKSVEEPEKPEPAPAPVQRSSETWVTKDDLEKAQFEAIAKYEILRKQRKAEKRQKEQLEQEKQNIINKLKPQNTGYRAMGSNGRYMNPYDSCY